MEIEKLKAIIADVLNVDPNEIKPETTFTEDLGADSLDLYQIIMEIEQEFDIKVSDDKIENIKTVQQAADLIREAVAAK
ncbi:MAG: acyl carrier protein [Lachnospiraceae bacterium]|jgi:acyl carrier protein|nr:acyl carrier protein [Lachnospiraceae bacterium]